VVPELPLVRDVLQHGVIGDNVALQTHPERFTQVGGGIEDEAFSLSVKVDVAFDAAFDIGDAGVESSIGTGVADVVRHLTIQVTHTVRAGETPLGPCRKIDPGSAGVDGLIEVGVHA
jgi:hypothetical protein